MRERMSGQQDFTMMFGGVQPSRQAADLVRRAISLGEDPTALTQEAGKAAQMDGRNKVGFFGRAETHLNGLKDVITSLEGKRSMNESFRRANKR